jgi:ferritin-like metal-binding protein YciE
LTDQNSIPELYLETLQELYTAETQIIRAFVQTAEAEATPEIKTMFETRLKQSEEQSQMFAEICDRLKYVAQQAV